jgi:hypothetical protein
MAASTRTAGLPLMIHSASQDGGRRNAHKKIPPFGGIFFLLWHLPWILTGLLPLTARILLLLARLLAAALLLLTGFLTRVLVLLARVLVHFGH